MTVHDVLTFTPVYRLEAETVTALFALEWNGALSFLLQRDPDGRPSGVQNHYRQYVRGRETFLRGPYDALLVVESDIIVPPDALKRLAALDCDVAYGVYVFRSKLSQVVNVFERYPESAGRPARNAGESLTVRGLWPEAQAQGVVPCSGGGLGIILIRRHVLEAVPFELPADLGGKTFCDTPWTQAVYSAGYTMRADTRVICGHKDTDGEIFWPPVAGVQR